MPGHTFCLVWSGLGATHARMAVMLAAYLAADIEIIAFGGEVGEHVEAGYTSAGCDFLAREADRLSCWHSDTSVIHRAEESGGE